MVVDATQIGCSVASFIVVLDSARRFTPAGFSLFRLVGLTYSGCEGRSRRDSGVPGSFSTRDCKSLGSGRAART